MSIFFSVSPSIGVCNDAATGRGWQNCSQLFVYISLVFLCLGGAFVEVKVSTAEHEKKMVLLFQTCSSAMAR